MKAITISGSKRESLGKRDSKILRRNNKVPCVIYNGKDNVHFSIDQKDFKNLVYTPEVYNVKFDIEGVTYSTVLQDAQYHPATDLVLHADFIELKDDRPVIVKLPVNLIGTSIGVKNGGKLGFNLRKIKVKALPAALPDSIDVNIEKLKIGQSIKVADLDKSINYLDSPGAVIVGVKMSRKVTAAEDDEDDDSEGSEGTEAGSEEAVAETEEAAS